MLLLSCVWITKSADDLATTMSNSTINPELFLLMMMCTVHCAQCAVMMMLLILRMNFMSVLKKTEKEEKGDEDVNQSSI